VTYRVSQWDTGFTSNITITNTGSAAINGWTLAFTYPGTQRVVQPGWSANWTQAAGSPNVTGTNVSYNSTIGAGTSIDMGFNGTWAGSNPPPNSFMLNNNQCTTG